MKKTMFALVMLTTVSAMAQNEKPYSIKGSMKNMPFPVQKVYLSYRLGDKLATDSVVPSDGNYSFAGKIADATQASMRVRYLPDADGKPIRMSGARDYVTFFLSPDNMEVSSVDSFANVKISGSKANDENAKLVAMQKPLNEKIKPISAEFSKALAAKDNVTAKKYEDQLDAFDDERRELFGEYLKKNMNSPLAFYALQQYAGYFLDYDQVSPLFEKLPASVKNSPAGTNFAAQLEIAKKTRIGNLAMDFTQNDTLGVPVKLSSLRGKYLLIDFWASWCGPCRRENPNVVRTYQAFRDKGFTILGVSLDQPNAKDKWLEAIHKDGLTWTHVSDLQYWQNAAAKEYGIQAIPQNLLLDPEGKIVAKNLSGDKLLKKLSELMP